MNGYSNREGESAVFCLPFQSDSTHRGKNLLPMEQILTSKSRPHVKEQHCPMKQTGIQARENYIGAQLSS